MDASNANETDFSPHGNFVLVEVKHQPVEQRHLQCHRPMVKDENNVEKLFSTEEVSQYAIHAVYQKLK